jgi:hydroxymethylglutaryl-CoA lyase
MRTAVDVLEVSPRDGLQNESVLVSTDDKLRLIDRAFDAGCRRIEVTSFVHPKKVPQMADAEAVCQLLPQRGDVSYAGLEIAMVVPASDTFGERNQGQRVDEGVAVGQEVIEEARRSGFFTTVTLAVAFGCPFEGDVPLDRLVGMARSLAAAKPDEIALADTIGVGVPGQVLEAFAALRDALGPDVRLRAHFHNTRNTGIANAFAALQAGVETLDASIGGIGGCPFAPQATGNIATEDLVYMLDRMRIAHGVALELLIDAAHWLEGVLGKPVPSMLARAGAFPPR